jgi:hypothetical protein
MTRYFLIDSVVRAAAVTPEPVHAQIPANGIIYACVRVGSFRIY